MYITAIVNPCGQRIVVFGIALEHGEPAYRSAELDGYPYTPVDLPAEVALPALRASVARERRTHEAWIERGRKGDCDCAACDPAFCRLPRAEAEAAARAHEEAHARALAEAGRKRAARAAGRGPMPRASRGQRFGWSSRRPT